MSQNWFWQFTTQWPWPRNSESCNSMIGLVALSWFAVELHCGHIDIQPDDIQGHIQGEGYLFAHWLFKILALYESLTDLLIYLLLLQRLQVIPQNAAARLVTGTRKYEQMTPVVRDLHWLPVRQFITCFTALLVYQSVSAWSGVDIDCNLLPAVIVLCLTVRSNLRSADSRQFSVPCTRVVRSPSRGTVCQLCFVHVIFRWKFLRKDWYFSYLSRVSMHSMQNEILFYHFCPSVSNGIQRRYWV